MMNMEIISYMIGGSFGLFLSVQYIIFSVFLYKNEEIRKVNRDLFYIIFIGFFIAIYSVFGIQISFFDENIYNTAAYDIRPIFYKIKLISGIVVLTFFVMLLRFILITIKDMTFVETDEYKNLTNRYMMIFAIISSIIAIGILVFPFSKDIHDDLYSYFSIGFALYLLIVAFIEFYEFSTILKKEKGKITPINNIRYKTILGCGVVSIGLWILENIAIVFFGFDFVRTFGSFYMYGILFVTIGLSMSLIFEYMEVHTRVSETNRKLSDLNRQIMDEVRTAQSLQISLLPLDKQKTIQKLLDMEISYMPMQSVGGDYYDFYALDEFSVLTLLGDASGHGIYAAMIWAMLKVEVEELIEEKAFEDLAGAFTILNKRITRILENTYSYATLFSCLIELDKGTMTYISAGHTDQLLYSGKYKAVNKIRNKNPIIGTFKNAKFASDTIQFTKGDAILMFSDGIVEGVNPKGEQLGSDGLADIFQKVCEGDPPASEIISSLLMELEDYFEGAQQKDDRTLMVIKI